MFVVSSKHTRRLFTKLQVRKATRPYGVSQRFSRPCVSQLAGTFTAIYNWSWRTCCVPNAFKKSTIILVKKISAISCLNDYRPVALMSIPIKMFERLVLNYLKYVIPKDLYPFQFAYIENPSVEHAVLITLHNALVHLDLSKPTYIRTSFIHFIWAFTTILPFKLHIKLLGRGIARTICD